jgi:hypothetical protein
MNAGVLALMLAVIAIALSFDMAALVGWVRRWMR